MREGWNAEERREYSHLKKEYTVRDLYRVIGESSTEIEYPQWLLSDYSEQVKTEMKRRGYSETDLGEWKNYTTGEAVRVTVDSDGWKITSYVDMGG